MRAAHHHSSTAEAPCDAGGVAIEKIDLAEGNGTAEDVAVVAGGEKVIVSQKSLHSVGLGAVVAPRKQPSLHAMWHTRQST